MTSPDLAHGRVQVHHGSLEALRRRPVVLGLVGLLALADVPAPRRVLLIGLGGGSYLRHLRRLPPA